MADFSLPPWLQTRPAGEIGRMFGEDGMRTMQEMSSVIAQQQGVAQNSALFPLKVQEAKSQIMDNALNLQLKQLSVDQALNQKAATVQAASVFSEINQSESGWADPNNQAKWAELAAKNPAIVQNPMYSQGWNSIKIAESAKERANEIKLRTQGLKDVATIRAEALTADEKKIKAAESFNSLADDLEANGDEAGAIQYRNQANALLGTIKPAGSSGGSDPAAIRNARELTDAEQQLREAEKRGDPEEIKAKRNYLNNLRSTAKIPGYTAADQRLALSSRTLPERALSNATMAWDQVNNLIDTLSPGSIGPMGVFNSMYQKTVGNVVPTKAGEKAIDQRTQLMQLKSSLEGMAGKDKARTGLLMKQIEEMMPAMGVLESPAAAGTSLKRIRDWVMDYSRRASKDMGILPPPWAMTRDDAADAVLAGEEAIARGDTPESNPRWGEKYMTREQYLNWNNSLRLPIKAQPPTNAPVQLPNP